ncbi:MAG: DUF5681 domain-containing protein [Nitrospiraceae bacterium]
MGFKKGRSGNAEGRPKGIPDRRTALRALLEPHAERLVKQAVAKALNGDMTAMRLCLERLIPPMKTRDAPITLEGLKGSLVDQGKAVLAGVTAGTVSPDEASALLQAVAAQARIVEVDELERRVAALERNRHEKSEEAHRAP